MLSFSVTAYFQSGVYNGSCFWCVFRTRDTFTIYRYRTSFFILGNSRRVSSFQIVFHSVSCLICLTHVSRHRLLTRIRFVKRLVPDLTFFRLEFCLSSATYIRHFSRRKKIARVKLVIRSESVRKRDLRNFVT